eukprot:scaffold2000_cov124-Alexandrium_tamarense.AAC.1
MAAAIISTVATAATTEPVATTGAVYYHSKCTITAEDNITDEENGDDEPWVLRQITFLGLTAPNQPDGESLAPPEEDSANKPNEQLDARNLAEFLIEIGACSVSVIDADANTSNEDPLFDEPTLTACPNDFLADNHDDEEDGEDISKYAMVFKDAAVGRNLWKRCHLSAHFPYAASVINKGKDRDETTESLNFIDYEAGSGVLGISAPAVVRDYNQSKRRSSSGAEKSATVVGVEIDADAIHIAIDNSDKNGVEMKNYLPDIESLDSEALSVVLRAMQ